MPKGFQKRMAPDWTADTYGEGGTAKERSLRIRRERGLEKLNVWKTHEGLSDVMDAGVLSDQIPGLINTEMYERIARWLYGLEMVTGYVTKEEEWKDPKKSKMRWDLLSEYHCTEATRQGRIAVADEEIEEKLKREALFNKWLSKSTGN